MSKQSNIEAATAAILRAARANPAITAVGLADELERGAIDGWLAIAIRYRLTFADWSAAMAGAIEELGVDPDERIAELRAAFPSRWHICDECGGEGRSSAHLGAFSMAELGDDPEFAEAYFAGAYDRACPCCKGSGKVKAIDEEAFFESLPADLREHIEIEHKIAEYRATESAMRAAGIQF